MQIQRTLLALALLLAPAAYAQEVALSYTADQAQRGKAVFDQTCVACHGANLNDGALGPPLKGPLFIQKYGGKAVDQLYTVAQHDDADGRAGLARCGDVRRRSSRTCSSRTTSSPERPSFRPIRGSSRA